MTLPAHASLQEFDEILEAVKNWGRWGDDDELGTCFRPHPGVDLGGRLVTCGFLVGDC